MGQKPLHSRRLFLVSTVTLVASSAAFLLLPQPKAEAQSFIERLRSLFTGRSGRRTASGRKRGGAVRGPCAAPAVAGQSLTALIPKDNLGLTTQAHPTFWCYLPYAQAQEVRIAEFMLLDEALDPVLEEPIAVTLPASPGLVSFSLPPDVKPLSVNQSYNWYLSIICSEQNPSRNPVVYGWVRRVAEVPGLTQQLQEVPPSDRYQVYAQNEIWYETLTELARHRDKHSDAWRQMLGLMQLEDVAQAPIIELQPRA
jgi:hypothetical protein